MRKFSYLFAITLIGTAAITSQVLLVREIINVFLGNELIYGLTIFLWLILYSMGSASLGRLGKRVKNKLISLIALQTAIAFLLPAEIYLSRAIKGFFGIPFGSLVDLPLTVTIILLLLAPITLILGFQFALGSSLLAEALRKDSSQVSRVYIFESIGAILGGLFLTYVLILFLNAFQITAVLMLAISISFVMVGLNIPRRNILFIGVGLAIIAVNIYSLSPFLENHSTQQSLADYRLVEATDSPYGRVTISEHHGSYNFYENGALLFSTADDLSNEETAHLSLLPHPNPKAVLLIGGGASGIANELSKYPIKLDILELDHKIIELARKTQMINSNLNILAMDGVKYIKDTDRKYDVILINLPDPTSALINRFYTQEFFKACQARLEPGGILTFNLGTSASYMGRELKLLNQSVNRTLSSVFQHTAVIPGNHNYYFASDKRLSTGRRELGLRWKSRGIQTKFFRTETLYYILWPDKIEYVREAVEYDDSTPINSEINPISYFHGLLIWASYFSAPVKGIFYSLMKIRFLNLLYALVAALLVIKLVSIKIKRITLPTIVMLLGFTGMCVQLTIVYAFQSFHGYMYQNIGLLTTAFMGGLAAGSFQVYLNYDRIQNPSRILKRVIGLLLINLLLIFLLLKVIPLALASFILALPVGAVFPLAVKLHEKYAPEIGKLAGVLYGSDLLGGALAAVITTVLFIPVFGILSTFGIAISLAAAALLMSYS